MFSLKKCLFSSLAQFLTGSFIFLVLSSMSCLYIFEINSLSVASFGIIFSHSEGCLFTLLIVSFIVQKLISLIRPHFWRRKCQPTPVFLPRELQGRGSLVGCRLWGCTESDMTEVT